LCCFPGRVILSSSSKVKILRCRGDARAQTGASIEGGATLAGGSKFAPSLAVRTFCLLPLAPSFGPNTHTHAARAANRNLGPQR
jgi:hypothetical protein